MKRQPIYPGPAKMTVDVRPRDAAQEPEHSESIVKSVLLPSESVGEQALGEMVALLNDMAARAHGAAIKAGKARAKQRRLEEAIKAEAHGD